MKTFVIVNTRQEFIHCWPEAPEAVLYLRDPHRHEAHIHVEMEVKDDDREVEIITLKKQIENWYQAQEFPIRISCEQVATQLARFLQSTYGLRDIVVTFMEDGENGAKVIL